MRPKASQARPACAKILDGEVWEDRVIAFMASHCGTGDVVHAGAYFGDFLPGLSRAMSPGARVWAFEPSSENHACAEHTIALNGLANVTLHHAALGARSATASLCVAMPDGTVRGGSSFILEKSPRRRVCEDVALLALDEVVPEDRHVSIVQLDVEDYEQKALEGALGTLRRCLPLLILEKLPLDRDLACREHPALGYREIGQIHGNKVLTAAASPPPDFDDYRDGFWRRRRAAQP